MLLKVGEEFRQSEMLQTGGIISHDVGWTWDVRREGTVAMFSLVEASVVAEVGSGSIGRDGTLGYPGDRRGVVGQGVDGGIGDIVLVSHDGLLS